MPPKGSHEEQLMMRRLRQEAEVVKNELSIDQARAVLGMHCSPKRLRSPGMYTIMLADAPS